MFLQRFANKAFTNRVFDYLKKQCRPTAFDLALLVVAIIGVLYFSITITSVTSSLGMTVVTP
jgi:hypothetical protein